MSTPPYMKLFHGDYLADTTHLTRDQHGGYFLLLMAMWRAGGKLPNKDAKLAAIAKATPKEWTALKPVLMEFFKIRGGVVRHKRITKELARYQNKIGSASEAEVGIHSETPNENKDKASQKNAKNRHNQNHNQKGRKDPIEGSFSTRQARSARDPNGRAPPPSVVNLNELRDRIAREAAELEAKDAG